MTKSYVKNDLLVVHHIYDNSEKYRTAYADVRYIMLFILKGKAVAKVNGKSVEINGGNFILINMNIPFCYNFVPEVGGESIIFYIHRSAFGKFFDDDYFLRPFNDERFFGKVKNFAGGKMKCIRENIDGIKKCLYLSLGRTHIMPRICTIISELCIIYDEEFSIENKSTDSIPARIIDYIDRHYFEDITYEKLMKKFTISRPTLNTIVKRSTDMSLHRYITSLRLKSARELMNKESSLKEITELCGFNSYSSFFRAYKSVYGITPSEDNNKANKKKWPLTK